MNQCANCKRETKNAKYCSRSCAVGKNNSIEPKRKGAIARKCKDCNVVLDRSRRSVRCEKCFDEWSLTKVASSNTIGAIRKKLKEKNVHPSWGNSEVRHNCRAINSFRPLVCQVCGYDKHVEHCHIKPVRDFTDDALLSDVNAPANVLILCRNHHWEFDHDLLKDVVKFQ